MSSYLQTVEQVYAEAARAPDAELCCVQAAPWRFPDLRIPSVMLAMNYGCGCTVDPRDLRDGATVLYVGVGGGLEALQFAYLTRRPGGVIAVDPVADMRHKARANFEEAAQLNPWFRPDFVTLLDGNALDLPVPDQSIDVVAQNCLFNVFTTTDLEKALSEVARVLRIGGLFATSDPITPAPLPPDLTSDEQLRARCLSGCQTLPDYLGLLTQAGFGKVEVRARFPYRYLHPADHPALSEGILLESVEVAAYKVPDTAAGPAIFTGRTATYIGAETSWRDPHTGFVFRRGIPMSISDAAATRLSATPEFLVTAPTFAVKGGGCC
ncbi:MAG: arsenosugar biosynthesis arsenite methyltransferase ArsM [Gemmataceae bacterium]